MYDVRITATDDIRHLSVSLSRASLCIRLSVMQLKSAAVVHTVYATCRVCGVIQC